MQSSILSLRWWGGRRYWWMMLFDFFAVYLPVCASLELIWLNHDRICWFTCWHDIILVTSSYHRNSLFQCIGAVLGAGILHGCTPTPVSDTLGANGLSSNNVSGGGLVSVTPEAGHHCDLISKVPMSFIIRFCSWGIADHALGPRCLCNCCW